MARTSGKKLLLLLASSLLISNCAALDTLESRRQAAHDIAATNHLQAQTITTPLFTFTTFQKITNTNAPLSIYIEGDGLAWIKRTRPSGNPTPTNPVALRLAASDNISQNIIYIARPCQYTPITASNPCPVKYWTSHRFAPEVIDSFNKALNQIKNSHNSNDLHLIGYSGGGTIATLLAQNRSDIKSLRTVAGNLDIDTFSDIHNVSKMPQSLNPADTAHKTVQLAQIHFIGKKDKIVPSTIFHSYKKRAGASDCITHKIITNSDHAHGWSAQWPELITIPPKCSNKN